MKYDSLTQGCIHVVKKHEDKIDKLLIAADENPDRWIFESAAENFDGGYWIIIRRITPKWTTPGEDDDGICKHASYKTVNGTIKFYDIKFNRIVPERRTLEDYNGIEDTLKHRM